MVAGLAVAAALLTANFIQAAEHAANTPDEVRPAMPAVPSGSGLSGTAGGAANLDASFPVFGRKLGWVYHVSGLFIFVDHVSSDRGPMLEPVKETHPRPRAMLPSDRIATVPTDARAASEADRNEADLNALFAVAVRVKPASVEAAKNAQGERGKRVYLDLCYACHQPDGQGLRGTFPMLARSDYMAADRTRAIRIVLEGLAGPVTVNGETINSVMPAQKTVLTDQQIADVLTYAFNAWENPGGAFTTSQVAAIRNEKSWE